MRQDLLTKEEFIPKRINQKFVTNENRIKYYNMKANILRQELNYINRPLFVNAKILNELMNEKDEMIFNKYFLLGKGFDFFVHTHIEKDKMGKKQFAIYQYLVIPMDAEQIQIKKIK